MTVISRMIFRLLLMDSQAKNRLPKREPNTIFKNQIMTGLLKTWEIEDLIEIQYLKGLKFIYYQYRFSRAKDAQLSIVVCP